MANNISYYNPIKISKYSIIIFLKKLIIAFFKFYASLKEFIKNKFLKN